VSERRGRVVSNDSSSCGTARSCAITAPAQEVAKVPKYRVARRSFWLIATQTHGRMEMLTLDAGGEMVLPVFSFREEGELFLCLEATEADWWLRETTTGELVSLLLSLCVRVDKVALDPLPGLWEREIVGLVSTDRRCFVRHLLGEIAAHSGRENPSGRVTGRSDPTRLRKGPTRPAQPAARW
jgi:hypothetical protein